jgi:hypothetical protein
MFGLVCDDNATGGQRIGSFHVPEGRWFTIEVRQRLSSGAGASNEVLVNRRLIGRSSRPNMYAGRPIERVRFGIVAIAAGSQTRPLALYFDSAAASGGHRAGMERGNLSQFDQVNRKRGSIAATTRRSFRGSHSAAATFRGSGANGYARGIFNGRWKEGQMLTYRAAFFLPRGFKAAMRGQVALMRWDNFRSHPAHTDHGGIVIDGDDKRARLIREQLGTSDQHGL